MGDMTDSQDALPDAEPQAATPQEEAKRRFREALDRKQHRHDGPRSHDPAVSHPHTSPAKPQRTFRRKSG
jgi:hypothetical protein